MEGLAELPPASWWEKIAHYIRMWRGVDFGSCEVSYKAEKLDTAGEYTEKQVSLMGIVFVCGCVWVCVCIAFCGVSTKPYCADLTSLAPNLLIRFTIL